MHAETQARQQARNAIARQSLGIAPLSFEDAFTLFLEKKAWGKPRTKKDVERIIRKHFLPGLKGKALMDIEAADIVQIVDGIKAPAEAAHAHANIRLFFNWCQRRSYRKYSPVEMEAPYRSPSRDRVLSDDEIRKIWHAAKEIGFPFGRIVQLLLLTGQRRSEIGSLRKEWISHAAEQNTHTSHHFPEAEHVTRIRNAKSLAELLPRDARTELEGPPDFWSITLPKEITKNGREHTFPFGALTASLLTMCNPGSPTFVFPARGQEHACFNGWSKCKRALDKASGVPGWTLHDLRRTFATIHARIGTPIHVTERLLSHVSGTVSGIVATYQRHTYMPEMREAVARYEKHLVALLAR